MIKAVVFDLDGTLLDTLEDLMDAVNYALNALGYPLRTLSEIRRFVGSGIRILVERSVPAGTPPAQTDKALTLFREEYARCMTNKTAPYSGVKELMRALRDKKIKIGVLSNKHDAAAKELVDGYFGDLTDAVLGQRDGTPIKPAPDGVNDLLKLLDAGKEEALYVGDSDVDMQTAVNAKVRAVGVSWGFRTPEVLRENGAACVIDKPEELLKML